ncbi:deoxycytidyl transferase [Phlyctochytrium planicorne]|nr:deoxycytidyl transferase [Phlyctochytrium planicorne]
MRGGRRGAFKNSDTAYKDGGDYMKQKKNKLQKQNNQVEHESEALKGIAIYFDGYLGPEKTMIEWREVCLRNGAKVYDWLTSTVTHIIAENITSRKYELWKRRKVVRPAWLTDSIAAGKLLNWRPYQVVNYKSQLQGTLPFESFPVEDGEEETEPPMEQPNELDKNGWAKQIISTAPGFIDKYYTSSRLSKISNWKLELKDFVAANRKDAKPVPKPAHSLRTIFHVDMDCFFASVAIRDRPHLKMRPVAVCHSAGISSNSSTSEIASCNYIARRAGCKNGMFLGRAKELCPDIVVVPYEFEKYDECAKKLYKILLTCADEVMAISCDEAFGDFSSQVSERGTCELDLAEDVRAEIFKQTGCSASIGIGSNMLLARVATHKAKPNGAHMVPESEALAYIAGLPVGDLPGVGYHIKSQLESAGIHICGDLQAYSMSKCKELVGGSKGQLLWEYCRGIDKRPFTFKARQSVGAEVNWGVRFDEDDQIIKFISELAVEVENRLKKANFRGSHITVKAKEKLYEGEPSKMLGCGNCADHSKSRPLNNFTDDSSIIGRTAIELFKTMGIKASEVRGFGIQMTKLQDASVSTGKQQTLDLQKMIASPNKRKESLNSESLDAPIVTGSPSKKRRTEGLMPNSLGDIDPAVFNSLPPDIQEEIRRSLVVEPPPLPVLAYLKPDPDLVLAPQVLQDLQGASTGPSSPLSSVDAVTARYLLRKWIQDSETPQQPEVDELKGFFKDFLRALESEMIISYLQLLRDEIDKRAWDSWRVFYNKLLLWTQGQFSHLYDGATVKLPSPFEVKGKQRVLE